MKDRKTFAQESYVMSRWNGIAWVVFAGFFLLSGHLDNLLVFAVAWLFGVFSIITIWNYQTGYGFLSFVTLVSKSNIMERVEVTLDRVGIPQPSMGGGKYLGVLKEKYGSNIDEIHFDIREVEGSQ